jgi:uncharacterized protein YbjT (DUF2867 family)
MTTAWLAGASGLVGGVLLTRLLEVPTLARVVSIGRRTLPLQHPKLTQAIVDFSAPSSFAPLPPPEIAFCCLGTTARKAGSREAFRAVDRGAVLTFARAAREKGARAFLHVTSLGADARSPIFYSAVKGEVEEAAAELGFESVYALRPSLIDGPRSERRPAERLGLAAAKAMGPFLGKYRPTPVAAVAEELLALARAPRPGVHVASWDGRAWQTVAAPRHPR